MYVNNVAALGVEVEVKEKFMKGRFEKCLVKNAIKITSFFYLPIEKKERKTVRHRERERIR